MCLIYLHRCNHLTATSRRVKCTSYFNWNSLIMLIRCIRVRCSHKHCCCSDKFSCLGAVLDCHEDIIRQIPQMEKVTPGILICAQAAVYRSMERNW